MNRTSRECVPAEAPQGVLPGISGAAHQVREIPVPPGLAPGVHGLDRALRLPQLYEVDHDLPSVFASLAVCVVGVGSVGANVVDQFARLGVGSLLLVDPARFDLENLITSPCTPDELGHPKVQVVGARAKALNPGSRVFVLEGRFEDLPLHVLAGFGFVVLATDNLIVEAEVGRRVLEMGTPLLQASVYGPTLSAQVRVLAASTDGEGPCLMCGFGRREFEELDRGTVFPCSGGIVAGDRVAGARVARVESASRPTTSLPQLCSMAADLCVLELTRRVAGIGDPLASCLVDYCGFTRHTSVTPLARKPDCPQEHRRTQLVPVRGLAALTPSEMVERAGCGDADRRRVTLAVANFSFASLAACGCSVHPRLARFLPHGSSGPGVETGVGCPECGQDRVAHPLHVHQQVPVAALVPKWHRSLSSLGAVGATEAWVRSELGTVLFHEPFPAQREAPRGGHS